ncbi:MAG: PIN domain-containing protein, partial [Chloroflexota bacterium]
MPLVVDANILVAELLRARGQMLVINPRLKLSIADRALGEARHELRQRITLLVQRGRLSPDNGAAMLARALHLMNLRVAVLPEGQYKQLESKARARIPRDPDDWPTVAAALALGADIWTRDADFLGCGCATWV